MTPERIAELKTELSKGPVPVLWGKDLADLLAIAEREAKLREAAEQMLAVEYVTVGGQLSPQYMAARTALRGALKQS